MYYIYNNIEDEEKYWEECYFNTTSVIRKKQPIIQPQAKNDL